MAVDTIRRRRAARHWGPCRRAGCRRDGCPIRPTRPPRLPARRGAEPFPVMSAARYSLRVMRTNPGGSSTTGGSGASGGGSTGFGGAALGLPLAALRSCAFSSFRSAASRSPDGPAMPKTVGTSPLSLPGMVGARNHSSSATSSSTKSASANAMPRCPSEARSRRVALGRVSMDSATDKARRAMPPEGGGKMSGPRRPGQAAASSASRP